MAFIKKQKLVEEIKELSDTQIIAESTEDNLQSALLEIVADELAYVAKLNRMIELSEEAEKKDLISVLKKSRANMKSNIAELYNKSKKILGLEEDDGSDKEEVTEAVDPSKVYNGEKIIDIVTQFTVNMSDETAAKDLESIYMSFIPKEDYTAEQIDAQLDKYDIDPQIREAIETEISQLPDAIEARKQEFKSDMDSDISILETLIEEEKFSTYAAKVRLRQLIDDLKSIKYDGSPDTSWNKDSNGKIIA